MKLVVASNNPGKLREFGALLAPLGWETIAQKELGVPECAEPHHTFVENALEKARHAARCTGLPALADDSGLCVDVLGGAPGVLSARFAGEPRRSARFYCALALVRHADDPQPLIACGEWHGEILEATRGHGGFGYDPLFLVRDLDQTAAEIDHELKNVLSHRGKAMRQLLDRLRAEQQA